MPCVLIVEDDPSVRSCLSRRFEAEGWTVHESSDPEEALGWASMHTVDLVLSDVVMPVMNGPDLVTRIQTLQPEARALLMSGYPESYLAAQRCAVSVAPMLRKPFQGRTLITRANAMLASRCSRALP
jgi:DNA-binding NtrC family response regulator